uniref:hypothetical protein n=1 Tax=uncultured Draconibacterium sp. TaxID=1573823 RepID=UPI0032162CE5
MKKKVNKQASTELDKFDRKQKKHTGTKNKGSKNKLSIYDEFEDEDLIDYSSDFDDIDEPEE